MKYFVKIILGRTGHCLNIIASDQPGLLVYSKGKLENVTTLCSTAILYIPHLPEMHQKFLSSSWVVSEEVICYQLELRK